MSLKKVLIIPVAISAVLLVVFSRSISESFEVLTENVKITPLFILVILAAIILQFIGHWLRAYKTRYILKPVRHSTTKFQFRALSLGYLFNAILPLRLGEFVRSYVMATADRISWGLTLAIVLFERSVDALFLSFIGITLVLLTWVGLHYIAIGLIVLLVFSVAILLCGTALIKENKWLIRIIYQASSMFNMHVKQAIRFKAWSIIYGLQQIAANLSMVKYLSLSLASWLLYFASIALVLTQFNFAFTGPKDMVLLSVAPYYGVSLPSGPGSLGSYSNSANAINAQAGLHGDNQLIFDLITWAVIVLPIALVGVVLLLSKTKEPFGRKLAKSSSQQSLMDKLSREEDISDEMELFLENYFAGNALSRIVHRMERGGEFKLLKYFKGGSDAITILAAEKDGRVVVKKIIAIEYKDRLKAQYEWLKNHKHKNVVKVLGERTGDDYYSIDIHYDEGDEMFFDFVHSHSVEDSEKVLTEVWNSLHEILYKKTDYRTDYAALDTYTSKHIWDCLEKASVVNSDLARAASCDSLIINGKRYDGIHKIIDKINKHEQARKDLATFTHADEVDGDIALDNILVSKNSLRPVIIDPAPDGNIINGPVFDFGKNMQSLYCGYEFLFRSNESVVLENGNTINFQDRRTDQYVRLYDYVSKVLAPKYLSDGEQKSMIFHAATLHIRRLKHQVYQNPAIALAMFAVGVRAYNDFLKQYKNK